MLNKIGILGKKGIAYCNLIGRTGHFLFWTIFRKPDIKRGLVFLSQELFSVGVLSLLIIVMSALFIGMVLGLQGYHTLEKFGSTPQLGQVVALGIVRELGPVMTALLFAGRAGSALTAEIGLMKTTQQLSSMEMMGVDPLGRIIAPRFWAGFIALPILTLIFNVVAIFGGYLIGVEWLGIDSGVFWSNMQNAVDFRHDVISGVIKSLVFGFIVTWIAIFQGYDTVPTAEGISRSTTRTVVYSSVVILFLDFVLTAMMIGSW